MKDSIYADGQVYLKSIGPVPVAVVQAKNQTLLYPTNPRGEVLWGKAINLPNRCYQLNRKHGDDHCPGRKQFFKDLRVALAC
ncbi:hypothetical protein [Ferrimonas senticii]|uniref:hypothetical protein n=1 Tax=Ferrimonas senticii TaxID=394566 RepID=UPI0003FBC956|nr:hypothetical protein [Ferrimonas senticii]